MKATACAVVTLLAAVLLVLPMRGEGAPKKSDDGKLPEGEGISARYPGDRGIARDRAVVFADDFELNNFRRWDENQLPKTTFLTRRKGDVHSGAQSAMMVADVPRSTGGGLIKWLNPGYDRLFARFYVKFPKDANYVHHFVHLSGERRKYGAFGQAGKKPDGTDFFSTGIEPDGKWGNVPAPGVWHFYTYWPDMKGSPGRYWGNDFSPARPIQVPTDTWVCVEIMVKCNTPGKPDGEEAFWINGHLAGRYKGFRWRTTPELRANVFWLLYYVTPEALQRSRAPRRTGQFPCYFDDVVVATQYIGPMSTGKRRDTKSGKSKSSGRYSPPPGWGEGEK